MGITVDYNLLTHVERWPVDLVTAIIDMANIIGSRPLRPPEARKLLQKYVEPLSPRLSPASRIPGVYPCWDDFKEIGRFIEEYSSHHLELHIGTLLICLPEWASYGKRTGRKPRIFCDLCWRHVVSDRKLCADHSPGTNQAEYRRAHRLRKTFHAALSELRRRDSESDCASDWNKVISGQHSLSHWLQQYRPSIASELAGCTNPTFADLLSALDKPEEEVGTQSLEEQRKILHASILQEPDQTYGMLRRAEAWKTAKRSRPRGGKRRNAGRKPNSS